MKAKLIKLNELDVCEATLEINNKTIVAYIVICPYKLIINKIYSVYFYADFFNGEPYKEIEENNYELIYTGEAYSYLVKGKLLNEKVIDVGGIIIDTGNRFEKKTYLINRFVRLTIDRLDVEFL